MSRFTITLSGLAEADATQFRAALEAAPAHDWKLVDGASAYLMVVDIDTVWGHMDWLRATSSGQHVVVFTGSGDARDCDLVLHKPLDIAALHDVLARAAAAADAHVARPEPAATAPVADPAPATDAAAGQAPAPSSGPASPEPEPHIAQPQAAEPLTAPDEAIVLATPPPASAPEPEPEPEPEPATLGECLLAGRVQHALGIEDSNGVTLRLDPERGGYHGSATLRPLRALLEQPMHATHPLDPDTLERMRQAPALPLTRLLWFAALCTTPRRLAPSLDAQAAYRLTRWPQIEREFPRHFRIATTMMKQPGTLGDVASAANTPLSDVIDFVNAYSVAGYVSADSPQAEAVPEAASGGMLSRLRRPFGRAEGRE